MKKRFLFFIFCLSSILGHASLYDIKMLGGDSSGERIVTELVNQCIQKAASNGGGTIYFPAGKYLTGAIRMESNITIHIESGAELVFSDRFEDYTPFVQMRWQGTVMNNFCPLFYAKDAERLTITGRGIIDGQGSAWWKENHRLNKEINDNRGKLAALNQFQQMWDDANPGGIEIYPYYERSMAGKFFRPPFIQFFNCSNIRIEGITIKNSPFWTVNPVMCDNVVIDGITVINPEDSPNTDGINPSSCSNVRISNCHLDVGDDCITIKSGRDADGRFWGRACENITITNCTMLAGHGGVVIGSEMSGSVRKVTISNCIFDGTDNGIRMKSSRGRGGVVEEIRVNNIVMNNIKREAFIFDLFYDKSSEPEPVSDRTPCFQNIHISNVTGAGVNRIGYIRGIEEMPVSDISFQNINMRARFGFSAETARGLRYVDLDWSVDKGPSLLIKNCEQVIVDNLNSKTPNEAAVVDIQDAKNIYIHNVFQSAATEVYCIGRNSEVRWGFVEKSSIKELYSNSQK